MSSNPPSAAAASDPPLPSTSKKRKRDPKQHILHQQTLRKPQWTYLHLRLVSSSSSSSSSSAVLLPTSTATSSTTTTAKPLPSAAPPDPMDTESDAQDDLDTLTTRTLLLAPLAQFLGHTGAAVPVDILQIAGRDVWVRVPREDGGVVVGAVSGWVGRGEGEEERVAWRVVRRGDWLVGLGLGGGGGEGVFG